MKQTAPQPKPGAPLGPGGVKRPRPLRVVRGPDGRPRIVRRGAAAFAALQANIPKVLRIGVIQGARITEERIIRKRETVTVGQSEKNHFVVPHPSVPGRYPLFEIRPGPKGDQYFLTFTNDMTGRVAFPAADGGVMDLAAIRSSKKAVPGARGTQVALTDDCKGKVVLGDTTMLFQFVVPPPIQPRPQLPASVRGGWLQRVEPALMVSLAISSVFHIGLLCFALIPDWPKPTLEDILASDYSPVQFQQVTVQEQEKPTDEGDEADTGDKGAGEDTGQEAAGDEGAEIAGAIEEAQPTGPQTTGRQVERVNVGGVNMTERQLGELQAKIDNSLSLENILGGGAGDGPMGIGSEFAGVSGSVTNLQDALAGTVGTSDGGGGGGTGGYTTLAGNLADGPAVGSVGGTGTAPTGPAVVPNREEATKVETKEIKRGKVRTSGGAPAGGSGRMSADVFRTTLGRKRGSIEACYNNALVRDPTLAGDLTFVIIINQQGGVSVDVERNASALDAAGVTSCIVGKLRTMNFASSPPTGGDFRVRLPISFIAP